VPTAGEIGEIWAWRDRVITEIEQIKDWTDELLRMMRTLDEIRHEEKGGAS
jgi:hypothetical protein